VRTPPAPPFFKFLLAHVLAARPWRPSIGEKMGAPSPPELVQQAATGASVQESEQVSLAHKKAGTRPALRRSSARLT
jgi:hypothetical protein